MDIFSQINECVTIGRCKNNCLLFANDLVLQSTKYALNGLAAASNIAGMKINTLQTEVPILHLSKILSNVLCKMTKYYRSRWISFSILGLHSQLMESKLKKCVFHFYIQCPKKCGYKCKRPK